MMQTNTHWASRRGLVFAVVVAVGLLVSCSSSPETANTSTVAEPPTGHAVGNQEQRAAHGDVDPYLPEAGLQQLTVESDAVVRGTVVGEEPGVVVAPDDPGAMYTIYTVRVEETISGPQTSTVDVAILTEIDGHPVQAEDAVQVGTDNIWLLTRIPPGFNRNGYVLTNPNGLLSVNSDGLVEGAEKGSPVAKQVNKLQRAEAVLRVLRGAADQE